MISVWLELINMSLISLMTVLINPLFWTILFLVFIQYKRFHELEIRMMGREQTSLKEKMGGAVFTGIWGGILGTIVIMILGVTVQINDFVYLLPLAIFLMLINVRYLCFSYGGGLLALCSLIFGFPQVNIPSLMAIIGVLHFVEALLMWGDGHKNAVPIWIEHKEYGIVGGYMLQRFWPIPFAILLMLLEPMTGAKELNLPQWWPIFKGNTDILDVDNLSLQISVVVAALGYGDLALSRMPRQKSKISALRLLCFSAVLITLSVLATHYAILTWMAAIFAPLGHELLIILGQREEMRREPLFRKYNRGVTILAIQKGSHGEQIGLHAGDILLHINNIPVNDKEDIENILKDYPPFIWIELLNEKRQHKIVEYKHYQNGIGSLGVVVMPRDTQIIINPFGSMSPMKKWISKFKKK